MNKRIKKKKFKEYHKTFCSESNSSEWECPKCNWDSLSADDDMKLADKTETHYGYFTNDFEVFYTCPVCNTKFSYWDSTS